MVDNVSGDLVWEIVRNQSSYIVKRKVGGNTIVFSRDPLNVKNVHSRTHSGSVNSKAIGIYPGDKNSVVLFTKKTNPKVQNKPASLINETVYKGNKSARRIAASVVAQTAAKYYRPDLRKDSVARVSAIKRSQRPVKADRAPKARGKKTAAAAPASTEA